MDHRTDLENLLLQIPAEHVELVHKSLQWLAFGNDPILESQWKNDQHLLQLDQLAETTLVSLKTQSLDTDCYIPSAELKELLSGLIQLEEAPRGRWISDEQPVTVVRLKDEIREELLSESFRHGTAAQFAFDEGQAKETIAITCLVLLTSPAPSDTETKRVDRADMYNLIQFAALYWIDFVDTEAHSSILQGLIRKLFSGDPNKFKKWTRLFVVAGDMYLNNKHSKLILDLTHHTDRKTGEYAPPIVWAAAFNLAFIVRELLTEGIPINAVGGARKVTALYMAVHEKHYAMASFLLDSGGDVADHYREPTGQLEYGWASSPLYLACHFDYPREWVDLLLKDQSRIGRPGWKLEVGMESAAHIGRLKCVQALVDAGADPNKGTEYKESYGCPLQAACDYGSEETVSFLLEKGADPNATGGDTWLGNVHTPLQMAAYRGRLSIVKSLLEYGADPNIQGGDFGNALIAAIWNPAHSTGEDDRSTTVELLLESGARVE
ncbi:MAG: hypothetical protein Q9174_006049, partial [Haloplaca sp. 1 TL-2023]